MMSGFMQKPLTIANDSTTHHHIGRQKRSSSQYHLLSPRRRAKSFCKSTEPTKKSKCHAKCPKETSFVTNIDSNQPCGHAQTGNLPSFDLIDGIEPTHVIKSGQITADQRSQVQENIEEPQKGKILLDESNGISIPANQSLKHCKPHEHAGGFITGETAGENDDVDAVNEINVFDTIIDLECAITPGYSKTAESKHSQTKTNKSPLQSDETLNNDFGDIFVDSELFAEFEQQADNGQEEAIESDDDLVGAFVFDDDSNSDSQATVIGGQSSPREIHINPIEADHCGRSEDVVCTFVKDTMPRRSKTLQLRDYTALVDETHPESKDGFADIIFFCDDILLELEEQVDHRPEKSSDLDDASMNTNVRDEDTNSDSSVSSDNSSPTERDKNFTEAANPDRSNDLHYADLVNFKATMGTVIEDSSRTNSIMPFIKQELLYKVQCERMARGEEELFLEPEAPKSYKLTEAEIRKKNARREQNRKSAKKSRVTFRQRELMLEEIVNKKSVEKDQLEKERQQLWREKADLISQLEEHLVYCPNN